jgi:hypothetical protein
VTWTSSADISICDTAITWRVDTLPLRRRPSVTGIAAIARPTKTAAHT